MGEQIYHRGTEDTEGETMELKGGRRISGRIAEGNFYRKEAKNTKGKTEETWEAETIRFTAC